LGFCVNRPGLAEPQSRVFSELNEQMGLRIQSILGESPDSKMKLSCQLGCLPIRRLLGCWDAPMKCFLFGGRFQTRGGDADRGIGRWISAFPHQDRKNTAVETNPLSREVVNRQRAMID